MSHKAVLQQWVLEALAAHGGKADRLTVAKHIWQARGRELEGTELFYTWQYDMSWAASELRKLGQLKPANAGPAGVWELSGEGPSLF
ncbi:MULTISPECIES: hypothetical protein [Chromobacterium]|uniref:Restriction system protein Mrr-like N-terminal domain-containing protein n=1 Tax=Chromobacterium haemolyticum TaxID=394935 RepID=A0ABS3GN07_9NEIS|nr:MULTISPECIES: hypothetical protein [Chromobacterium]MBK0414901.1 hypothetical protein [Chromobacterium haemolyticum]MBO0416429.1 hypothetical protein [Chromobacterium haemolyticum]MBO0499540.1 hypothetical protein [Chromobacterium haemolyticum]MDH0343929.1 hypothetical protein [Chromobacterium haemolyticum]PTU71731.1 hypothetical protein DBB33_20895 [Chromobacterium haemolyticum]